MLLAAKDGGEDVRRVAFNALLKLACAYPELKEDVLTQLKPALQHRSVSVWDLSVQSIGALGKDGAEFAEDCLRPLLDACKDGNESEREAAGKVIG